MKKIILLLVVVFGFVGCEMIDMVTFRVEVTNDMNYDYGYQIDVVDSYGDSMSLSEGENVDGLEGTYTATLITYDPNGLMIASSTESIYASTGVNIIRFQLLESGVIEVETK